MIDYFGLCCDEERWIDYDDKCDKVIIEDTIDFKTRCNSEWK
jgi:hypothetical protein